MTIDEYRQYSCRNDDWNYCGHSELVSRPGYPVFARDTWESAACADSRILVHACDCTPLFADDENHTSARMQPQDIPDEILLEYPHVAEGIATWRSNS